MQQLPEAVRGKASAGRFARNTPRTSYPAAGRGWVVSAGYASDQFDAVIVATPAAAAASAARDSTQTLSAMTQAIPYSSSVTVALGFDQDVRASLPPGFGFLVPRSEGKRMLAATFRPQQISASRSRRPGLDSLLPRGQPRRARA